MSEDSQEELSPEQLRAKATEVIAAFRTHPELLEQFEQDPVAAVTALGFPEHAAEDLAREVGPSLHEVEAYVCNRTCRYTCRSTCVLTSLADGGDDGDDDGEGEVLPVS
jgi:hypothetical protein